MHAQATCTGPKATALTLQGSAAGTGCLQLTGVGTGFWAAGNTLVLHCRWGAQRTLRANATGRFLIDCQATCTLEQSAGCRAGQHQLNNRKEGRKR